MQKRYTEEFRESVVKQMMAPNPVNEEKTSEQRHQAMTWAQRLKRVFNVTLGTLS
jgi:hypothetical protein